MPDKFDRYREALVVETETTWPESAADLAPAERSRLSAALHADPEQCAQLEYIRQHTGFRRRIVATDEDLQRVRAASPAAAGE